MGRRLLHALLTLLGASSVAYAQSGGRIVGRVSSADGRALSGIQVTVTGTTRGAVSDSAGRYSIGDVAVGRRVVQARAIGYATASDTVEVVAGQAAAANFSLTTTPARPSRGGWHAMPRSFSGRTFRHAG